MTLSSKRAARRTPTYVVVDAGLKALMVALLVLAATHTELPRFGDKAMVARAVLYPLLVSVLPAAWWTARRHRLAQRRRPPTYPAIPALLITVPFLIDIAGNALDLYDGVAWFDDACHCVNWFLLCSAFGLLVRPAVRPRWASSALAAGFGAVTAVVWEIAEYLTFVPGGAESVGAYRDTIGDLALGLGGSLVAGVLVALVGGRAPITETSNQPDSEQILNKKRQKLSRSPVED